MPVEAGIKKTDPGKVAKQGGKFDYKANGIFNGEFVQQLDAAGGVGDSRFYNFYVKKDGDPYGNYGSRGALRPNDFEKVLEFTEGKIVELAEEIICGRIDVRPYRLGTESACSFCDYKAVCRFDWQINEYNFLGTPGKLEALEKMRTADG